MKDLKGTIRSRDYTAIQRVEGNTQAPMFIIYDRVYFVYSMNESYVTNGVEGEHHTVEALLGSEFRHSEEPIQWFNLYVDYHANTWTLTKTERPEED